MGKRVFLLAIIAGLLLTSVGCDAIPGGRQPGAGTDSRSAIERKASRTPDSSDSRRQSSTASPGPEDRSEIEITLYFSDDQAEKLVAEKRSIPATAKVAATAIEELIKGPEAAGQPTVPSGTRLLDLTISNGEAQVNLSREFVDNHPGGSAGERLTVYSIVNTLTEFPTITSVSFLVEGEPVETLAGHMDLSGPLQRDE